MSVNYASAAEDEYLSRITMIVTSKKTDAEDRTAAWDFSIRIAGYFEFTDRSVEIVRAKKLSLVNGASIVYGLARDLLQGTSLRGQKPSILLPSLNFQEFAELIAAPGSSGKKLKQSTSDMAVLEAREASAHDTTRVKASGKGKSKK